MRILVLHNIESISRARCSQINGIVAFERYAPEHDYLYHRIVLPVTETIRNVPWDAIIFESTALGICTFRPRELFFEQKRKWSFLANTPAVKVVFPQDDANCGRLMDDWFLEMHCDLMYTVRIEFVKMIYPRSSARCVVKPTMSGYVDDYGIPAFRNFAKAFGKRKCDIGQRVTMYAPRGGRHSRLKGETALVVKDAAMSRGLGVDISVDDKDVFLGTDWFRFLGNCRFVLGAEGGMSIWDPYGEIGDAITDYVSENPGATFEDIEAACFPGKDGICSFVGFSPRIFEAAMMGCCQILVEGEYRGILRPYEHYIPLKKDCSNIDEVFTLMADDVEVQRCIARTYDLLINDTQYRYSTMVQYVLKDVEKIAKERRIQYRGFDFYWPHRHLDFRGMKMQHRFDLEDITIRQEESCGFVGEELVKRVAYLIGDQFVEPMVSVDHYTDTYLYLYRAQLQQKVRNHICLMRSGYEAGA